MPSRCWWPRVSAEPGRCNGACSGCWTTRNETGPGSVVGASTTSTAPAPWFRLWSTPECPPMDRQFSAPCGGCSTTSSPRAAGARTFVRTGTRMTVGQGPVTASQTGWALLALLAVARGRAPAALTPRSSGASHCAGHLAAAGRQLGRAALHRHRLPRGLLDQLPPLPAGLPAHCPWPVLGRSSSGTRSLSGKGPMTDLVVAAPLRVEALAVGSGHACVRSDAGRAHRRRPTGEPHPRPVLRSRRHSRSPGCAEHSPPT